MATLEETRKHSKNHLGYKGTKKPTTGCPICLDIYYKAQQVGTSPKVPVTPQCTCRQCAAQQQVVQKAQEKTNTYVFYVLDRSGSMSSIAETTRKTLRKELFEVKSEARKNNLDVSVSLRQFASQVEPYSFYCATGATIPETLEFWPNGNTALIDAVCTTLNDMKALDNNTGKRHSFLLKVITDGDENYSTKFTSPQLRSMMDIVQQTDRYTLTFQLPPGRKASFCRVYNIPEGNVIEWQATDRGMEEACVINTSSFSQYATSRSKGIRAVKQYYTTDLSNIKQADLNQLTPINNQVRILKVLSEASIKPFVEAQLKFYRPGSAYYQLTKNEEVQSYKVVLIRDKSTKKIYAGDEARSLIGLPPYSAAGGTIKVKVGNHANFDVFVQSSSNNRKLVRGTDLIIWQ